jgi:HEAT repeat protein
MAGYAAVRYITKGIKSKDERVLELACEALCRKGDRNALDALVEAMKGS